MVKVPHKLVPEILLPFLSANLVDQASSATTYPQKLEVVERVIAELKQNSALVRRTLKAVPVPALRPGLTIFDLDLEVRTFHCLNHHADDGRLPALTFGDLIRTRGFGITSLYDFVAAIDGRSSELTPFRIIERAGHNVNADGEDEKEVLSADELEHLRQTLEKERRLDRKLAKRHFPAMANGFDFRRIPVSVRLKNVMERIGVLEDASKLEKYTILQVFMLPNCGRLTLLELLNLLPRTSETPGGELAHQTIRQLTEILSIATEEIAAGDVRLGKVLHELMPDALSLRECIERILGGEATGFNNDKLRREVHKLAQLLTSVKEMTLEEEIESILCCVERSDRARKILRLRMGLVDGREHTLQEVANEFGLTRERVRQICKRIEDRLDRPCYTPTFTRAIDLVTAGLPARGDKIRDMLVSNGMGEVGLMGLRSMAELLGKPLPFGVAKVGEYEIAVEDGQALENSRLSSLVRKEIESVGVVLLEDLSYHAVSAGKVPDTELVRNLVYANPSVAWLDESREWFWVPSIPRNRLANMIEKALVAGVEVPLVDLRRSVGRHYRMRGFSPPIDVLREFCRQHPEFDVSGEKVRLVPGAVIRHGVNGIESIFLDVLRANGGVMRRSDLEKECRARGMAHSSFYVTLDNSPILTRVLKGVYSIVGTKLTPGQVEDLKPSYLKQRVLVDYGWTRNGEIWIAYDLSEHAITTGQLTIPSALKAAIAPPYTTSIGLLTRVAHGTLSLGAGLMRLEAKPHDFLALRFNLSERTASVELGDEELVQQLSDASIEKTH